MHPVLEDVVHIAVFEPVADAAGVALGRALAAVGDADLVLAGCAILDAIRDAFPLPRLRVADRGLREGMLVELMRADDVWTRG